MKRITQWSIITFIIMEYWDFLRECVETSIVQRIKSIGMNCGCEYTAFPQFADIDSYSRYDHSIGVALIIWHFTHDRKQAILTPDGIQYAS